MRDLHAGKEVWQVLWVQKFQFWKAYGEKSLEHKFEYHRDANETIKHQSNVWPHSRVGPLTKKKTVEMVKSPRIKTVSNQTKVWFRGVESLLLWNKRTQPCIWSGGSLHLEVSRQTGRRSQGRARILRRDDSLCGSGMLLDSPEGTEKHSGGKDKLINWREIN